MTMNKVNRDIRTRAEEMLARYNKPNEYTELITDLLTALAEAENGWQDCADDYQSIGRDLADAQDLCAAQAERIKELEADVNMYREQLRICHEPTLHSQAITRSAYQRAIEIADDFNHCGDIIAAIRMEMDGNS